MGNKAKNSIVDNYKKTFDMIKNKTDAVLQPEYFLVERARNNCSQITKKCNKPELFTEQYLN